MTTTNLTKDQLAERATGLMRQSKTAGQAAKILTNRGFRTIGGAAITKSAIYNARSENKKTRQDSLNTVSIKSGPARTVELPRSGIWVSGATSTTRVLPFTDSAPIIEDKTTIAVTQEEKDFIDFSRDLSKAMRSTGSKEGRLFRARSEIVEAACEAYRRIFLYDSRDLNGK